MARLEYLPGAAVQDVIAERARQFVVEGWTPEHDDAHSDGELAAAAANYTVAARLAVRLRRFSPDIAETQPPLNGLGGRALVWPWAITWWKPASPRRMLVKAAALIIAEIERIDRAVAGGQP